MFRNSQQYFERFPMRNLKIAFLLNRGPMTWQFQEELHFRLCRELVARGASPVLVYAGKGSEEVLARMRESGAEVIVEAGLQGWYHYYKILKSTTKRFNINLVDIRYFQYSSILPWLSRLQSVRRVVYNECNSWMSIKRNKWSWRRAATRLHTKVVCQRV